MKVLLVGNYSPDRQRSMQRFAFMMRAGLRARGLEVRLLRPPVVCGKSRRLRALRKWFSYADKYVLFPPLLRRCAKAADIVHICDHSNAMYGRHVANKPHLVTCHDLLAVRGALGEDTDCPASFTGKILQRWILAGLKDAQFVACDSSATRGDLLRLAGKEMESRSRVVLLGLMPTLNEGCFSETKMGTTTPINPGRPYLLNVGSSLRRKNRDAVLRVFSELSKHWDGDLVFAGEPLTPELGKLKKDVGLNGRVVEIPQPSDATLRALYSGAFALLFPTKFEGFGWPVIEAQACGCPVISSNSTSIPEVAGDAALLRAPEDEPGFVADVLRLRDATVRETLVQRGRENVKRFTPERMVDAYVGLYQKLCARSGN